MKFILKSIFLIMLFSTNCYGEICTDENEKDISVGIDNSITIWTARNLFSRFPDFVDGIYIENTGIHMEEHDEYVLNSKSNKVTHVRHSTHEIPGYTHNDKFDKFTLIKEVSLSPQQAKEISCLSNNIWISKAADLKRKEQPDVEEIQKTEDILNKEFDEALDNCKINNRLTKDYLHCRDIAYKKHPLFPPILDPVPEPVPVGLDYFQFVYLIKNENIVMDTPSDEKTKKLYMYILNLFNSAGT